MAKRTWYQVGYEEGRSGKAERPPQGSIMSVIDQYRLGWGDGDADRRCLAAGYAEAGPKAQ